MRAILKFKANDGSEWDDEAAAIKRDKLVEKVDAAMKPLGKVPEAVEDGKGWLQHNLEVVYKAKDDILDICREQGLHEHYPVFNEQGRKCHALSVIGRILDDYHDPLSKAWSRFARIDEKGREHQQCYFAYTNGPAKDHVCVEDRS